jgi:fatty-acyl-CoA synthase
VTTFRAHPRRWAVSEPDRVAIQMGGSGDTITYGALDARANRAAHLLRRIGLRRGDHLAILIENHPRFLEVAWGAQNAGLYFTPISWRFRLEEIAFILEDCGARALVFTAQQAELVAELRERLPDLAYIGIETDIGTIRYEEAMAALPDTPIADESRGSDMVYSSGSTGRPKGIKQALPSLGVDGLSAMFAIYAERYGWGEDTVYLMPAPIYHSGPLRFAMAMQQVGARLVLMEKFDAEQALALCETERVTHAHWVPTMLARLLKRPPEARARYDLSSVRIVVHGAAPCAPEIKHAMIDWLGPILEESYGGTEGNGLTMISSAEWLEHPGSVGRPFLGAVHIIDDDGHELGAGEIGTVFFSGGPRFAYHNNQAKTDAAHDVAGRSTLGDLGYLDADGYLFLTDRKDHMAISGGVNVFPQEAENALVAHPAVADAAVFGVPDDDMGEVLHAVVQPVDRASAGLALEAALIAHCRAKIATIKCPRSIAFADQLPRHDTGKIYTRLLKTDYLAARSAVAQGVN